MEIELARDIAYRWTLKLLPYTDRAEIAGSIRRQKPEVKDIEIVCIPKFESMPDLFGVGVPVNMLNRFFEDNPDIHLAKNGDRYKQIVLEDIKIDLFIVLPPSQWGVQFLLRTGSAAYSKRFVTCKQYGGMLPGWLKCKDGALWKGQEMMPTPEERDVYKLIGLPFVPPWERTA